VAVARAMGWTSRPDDGWDVALWVRPDGEICLRDDCDGMPFYSTEIAAAYQVVEWMNRERKWVVRVESDWDGSASVEVFTDEGTPSHWRSIADVDADTSPAEAICWAFLAAMGVDWREEE